MHIPDAMLQGSICPVTAAAGVLGLTAVAVAAFKSGRKPTTGRFAAVTAMIFAGQMMNFPIQFGTSGHLLGGVLSAALLGTPFGILSLALVVTIQSLVFSDGGIMVLGANVLNMALIGSGIGGMLHSFLHRNHKPASTYHLVVLAFCSWVSVMMAAVAVSVELAASGAIALDKVLPAMAGTHALIGIGEALLTVTVYMAFASLPDSVSHKWSVSAPLMASVMIALIASPFACSFPDGLEWVAQNYHIFHDAAPAFSGLLPGYTIPAFGDGALSTGLAGFAGTLLSFCAAWMLARKLNFGGGSVVPILK